MRRSDRATPSQRTTPTFLEFFAGAGLVRLALEPDWKCICANEICEKKAATYRDNFGGRQLVVGDVADVRSASLPAANMAWASFPCQDLSLAGRRQGLFAARSGTFWSFWRLICELLDNERRPPIIVIENVMGLLTPHNFHPLCEGLAALRMRFGTLVIDARWFVPQSRQRVFVIAVDENLDLSSLAGTLPAPGPFFPRGLIHASLSLPDAVAARWLWWKPPPLPEPPASVETLLEDAPSQSNWRSPEQVTQFFKMMSPANRQRIRERLDSGGLHVGFLYRRTRNGRQRAEVRFDGLAGCLRTPVGGSSRQTVVFIESGAARMRLLTSREAARLMGVRDTFRLPSSDTQAYHAMADGVVVPLVKWLSRSLLLPLAVRCERGRPQGVPPRRDAPPNIESLLHSRIQSSPS